MYMYAYEHVIIHVYIYMYVPLEKAVLFQGPDWGRLTARAPTVLWRSYTVCQSCFWENSTLIALQSHLHTYIHMYTHMRSGSTLAFLHTHFPNIKVYACIHNYIHIHVCIHIWVQASLWHSCTFGLRIWKSVHAYTFTYTSTNIYMYEFRRNLGIFAYSVCEYESLCMPTHLHIRLHIYTFMSSGGTLAFLHTATCCNTLSSDGTLAFLHTASHCSTLQHTATYCNTLKHTEFRRHLGVLVHLVCECKSLCTYTYTYMYMSRYLHQTRCETKFKSQVCIPLFRFANVNAYIHMHTYMYIYLRKTKRKTKWNKPIRAYLFSFPVCEWKVLCVYSCVYIYVYIPS